MRLTARSSLFLALVIGAIATFLVRGVIQNVGSSSDLGRSGTVVVMRATVPFGTALSADNLREIPWASNDPIEGSFATVRDVLKDGRRLALASLQRNEPVLASRVTAPGQRATLSTQLDEGMRAVTIRVDEVRGVAGFVLPGDRVDVILTRGESGQQEAAAYADVLLQGVKVLAVDQLTDERQGKPSIARAVTLELTGQQAQKVILAQGIGHLSLALRGLTGGSESGPLRVTVEDLGAIPTAARDQIAMLEKRLADASVASDAARAESERQTALKLSEVETRLRGEMARSLTTGVPAVAPTRAVPPGFVVTVTRNGSKVESYNVAAER